MRGLPAVGAGLLAAALAGGLAGHALSSDDLAGAGRQAGQTTTVRLEYRETAFRFLLDDLLFRDIRVTARSRPFPKEPASASERVVRGVLRFGGGSSNAVSFLWQLEAKKLFLDLNRNGDLSDDAGGVFSGRPTGPQIPWVTHHVFTNIHLSFPATSAGAPLMMDLNFLRIRESAVPLVNAMARSYWRGKVAVAGHDWEIGLLPNISDQPGSFLRGQMLLRPWEERDKAFSGWSGSTDSWAVPFEYRNRVLKGADTFEFSPRVFFGGQGWQLDWGAEPATGGVPFAVRLTEQFPPLGEVRTLGRFVDRVVLTGGPYAVVLVRPEGSVRIPAGSYNQPSVWLKQGETEAYFNSLPRSGQPTLPDDKSGGVRPVSGVAEAGKVVVVDPREPAVLAIGGPLTNSVVVSRHGRELKLTYRLVGAGGGNYKVWEYWRTKRDVAPEFVIYRGAKKIAAGKFEFG